MLQYSTGGRWNASLEYVLFQVLAHAHQHDESFQSLHCRGTRYPSGFTRYRPSPLHGVEEESVALDLTESGLGVLSTPSGEGRMKVA